MAYFACNLMETPSYFTPELAKEYEDTCIRVRARMDKLETALRLSAIPDPAVFADIAGSLFRHFSDTFETMAPTELADMTDRLCTPGATAPHRLEWPNTVRLLWWTPPSSPPASGRRCVMPGSAVRTPP